RHEYGAHKLCPRRPGSVGGHDWEYKAGGKEVRTYMPCAHGHQRPENPYEDSAYDQEESESERGRTLPDIRAGFHDSAEGHRTCCEHVRARSFRQNGKRTGCETR